MDKIKDLEKSLDTYDAIENNCQAIFLEEVVENKTEKVLCNHCGRTTNNGIRCLGICVADNDY